MKINRFKVIQIHAILAGFLLPLAIVFFAGGILYTFGIKGNIDKTVIELKLDQPFRPDIDALTLEAERALADRALALPNGGASLKKDAKKEDTYVIRWNELGYSVTLEGRNNERVASLIVRERGILTQVMRIHRAEAGAAFKLLSTILVGGLLIIFATGIYMALVVPRLRRTLFIAMGSGAATFLAVVVIFGRVFF